VSIIDRFFGKRAPDERTPDPLVANTSIERPLSLQVLFSQAPPLDSAALSRTLRTFDRSTSAGRCDLDEELLREGKVLGLAGWGRHVVRYVGFDFPMPADAVEACVAGAHYDQGLKQKAREHRAHIILYYAGYDTSPLEQYVALAVVAAVFGRNDGLVVVNESGHTSLPMSMLLDIGASKNSCELLRKLPLPYLYCGFVKHQVEDVRGVWMRTYGAPLLGLPDFAAHAAGHHEGQRYFDIFENVFRYVLESGARLSRGHTMQIGTSEFMRLRAPKLDESYLMPAGGELFVMEIIGAHEINR
jgi:hypothetical protein